MLATRTARTFSNVTARHLHLKEKKGGKRFTSPFVLSCDRRFYASQQEQVVGKGVLVTGCDSGFGFSVAKHLHSKGFTVFAGCLLKDKGHDGVKELDDMKCARMKTVQLNVCKEEEVQSAVEHIRASLKDPEKGLWGLVNNAGISTFGEVEFTSMDTYKEVAEVNLWGTVRVTKACLPLLRRAKVGFSDYAFQHSVRAAATGWHKEGTIGFHHHPCSVFGNGPITTASLHDMA